MLHLLIEERESESSSEVEDEPIHYEDDYVKFDYYDSDGISIEKRVGAGLAKYTFSDIQELAASGTTVNVEFEINSNSTISMDDYMKTLNSFIIKISFATQTSEKSRLGRENWRMVFR